MHCMFRRKPAGYLEFIRQLADHGVEIDQLDADDYGAFAQLEHEDFIQYATSRFRNAALVLHNRQLFNLSVEVSRETAHIATICMGDPTPTAVEAKLNDFLYQYYAPWTHGTHTPPRFIHEDMKRKDVLAIRARALHIPTPHVFASFDEAEYPCIMKPATGKCSRDIYVVENDAEAAEAAARIKGDFVIQEYVESPTGYPCHIRAVAFGDVFEGAFLSLNTDARVSTYESASENIPLDRGAAFLTRNQYQALEACGLQPGEMHPSIIESMRRVGDACSAHGTQIVGVDLLVRRKRDGSFEYLTADVNKDPAPDSYLPILDPELIAEHVKGEATPVSVAAVMNAHAALEHYR